MFNRCWSGNGSDKTGCYAQEMADCVLLVEGLVIAFTRMTGFKCLDHS